MRPKDENAISLANLPAEIRLKIWDFALSAPSVITLEGTAVFRVVTLKDPMNSKHIDSSRHRVSYWKGKSMPYLAGHSCKEANDVVRKSFCTVLDRGYFGCGFYNYVCFKTDKNLFFLIDPSILLVLVKVFAERRLEVKHIAIRNKFWYMMTRTCEIIGRRFPNLGTLIFDGDFELPDTQLPDRADYLATLIDYTGPVLDKEDPRNCGFRRADVLKCFPTPGPRIHYCPPCCYCKRKSREERV